MKNLVKLYFILLVFFSNSICFAGPVEEELELYSDILVPIICNFNDSSSGSKCASLKIIEKQKKDKAQLSDKEVDDICREVARNSAACIYKLIEVRKATGCTAKDYETYNQQLTATGFANSKKMAWENKVSNCGEYADLVMIAFEFNRMNNKLLHKTLNFKDAMVLEANEITGSHRFILVEGLSGTMFAVDPWMWTVTKVDSFPKLSDIKKDILDSGKNIIISSELNQKINSLFINNSEKGAYYDLIFVKENTEWYLSPAYSKKIQNFAHEYNDSMRDFYNVLRRQPKFPQLILEYNDLFPDRQTAPTKKDPEEKKVEAHKL